MFKKYVYYNKIENVKEYRLLKLNNVYLCEIDQEDTKIKISEYDNVYYNMMTFGFLEHFITIKEYRKLKLLKLLKLK